MASTSPVSCNRLGMPGFGCMSPKQEKVLITAFLALGIALSIGGYLVFHHHGSTVAVEALRYAGGAFSAASMLLVIRLAIANCKEKRKANVASKNLSASQQPSQQTTTPRPISNQTLTSNGQRGKISVNSFEDVFEAAIQGAQHIEAGSARIDFLNVSDFAKGSIFNSNAGVYFGTAANGVPFLIVRFAQWEPKQPGFKEQEGANSVLFFAKINGKWEKCSQSYPGHDKWNIEFDINSTKDLEKLQNLIFTGEGSFRKKNGAEWGANFTTIKFLVQ